MSDSVRMMDLVALSKNLGEVRRYDPENRAAAQRQAGAAAAHKVEEHHKDVDESQEAQEARIRERKGNGGKDHPPQQEADSEPEETPEPVPEVDEGHLLDLKA